MRSSGNVAGSSSWAATMAAAVPDTTTRQGAVRANMKQNSTTTRDHPEDFGIGAPFLPVTGRHKPMIVRDIGMMQDILPGAKGTLG
ncbi:hypothetical protein DDE01_20500 [Desulfovibrio desulfuricans]|nr:hypothetical protein DDE01_20500 [Desulfovibrio desulfuricans]